jgi:hypothetical protein
MKIKLVIAALLSFCAAKSQVGIGTTTPKATLDIKALPSQPLENVGVLFPMVEELPEPCEDIPNGLVVYYDGPRYRDKRNTLYIFSQRECEWKRFELD